VDEVTWGEVCSFTTPPDNIHNKPEPIIKKRGVMSIFGLLLCVIIWLAIYLLTLKRSLMILLYEVKRISQGTDAMMKEFEL
jgi:hypothetical protein